MREAHQIFVVDYRPEIVARHLFLQILEERKNFDFSENSFFLGSLVLFEDDPDFEVWFASKEDIRLWRLTTTALNDYLFPEKLDFPFLIDFVFLSLKVFL